MAKLTRRGLIKRVSIGAGAVGVLAATGVVGDRVGVASAGGQALGQTTSKSSDPMVVCVNDPSSGNVVFMQGEIERTVHNPGLVQSILSL
jgi:hypothetical protein